ncbi:MAG TPA: hypothetical protein VHF51_14930 [Solirubrobacteraceae bacterium]|nr:hypothetical protein [Solirubrobacteraceae bacterium]
MTMLTLAAMALVGLGAAWAIARRSTATRHHGAGRMDDPVRPGAGRCAAAHRHRPRRRIRGGRRSLCR